MGAQIFLKSGTNKAGKAPLFIYAQHKGKSLRKILVYQSILKIGIRKHIK